MSTTSGTPVPSADSFSGTSRDEVRQQLLAACAASGARPDLDSFLSSLAEPERSELRAELVAATVEQVARNGETVDQRPPISPASAGTIDFAPAVPLDRTVDQIAAATDARVDHISGEPSEAIEQSGPAMPLGRGAPIPATIAGYEILRVLGRVAMGVVYKARQRGLKRVVALKMILAGAHASENDLVRFRSEALAVAELQHAGIVQLFEVGEADGQPFFSLEYVNGASLGAKVSGTPQPPREAARLVQLMAEAMDYAHLHGVIHRDLKPANVLLTADGMPKITDFGLAKRLEDDSGHTRSGTILGTPSYMAPEQAEGKARDVGPLADLYSLGAILYELLTGRPPFRGASVVDTLEQVRTREPVPPTQFQPGVPRDLETICLQCLQKEAGKRYHSAGALAEDLRRYLAGEPIAARPVGRTERALRWCRRNPRVAVLTGIVVLLVVVWAVSSSILALNLKAQKDETEIARIAADDNAQEATKQAGIARNNEEEATRQAGIARKNAEEATKQAGIARKNAEEATRQAAIAEQNAEAARREAVIALQNEKRAKATAHAAFTHMVDLGGKLHNRLQSKRLAVEAEPELRRLRAELIAMLKQSLVTASKDFDASAATTSFGRAAAAQQLGDLFVRLGQAKEAALVFQQGYDLVKKVADAEPDNDLARANLGVMLLRLGNVALDLDGDAQTARKHYAQARALHQEVLDKPRSNFYTPVQIKRVLSHDDVHLGKALLALGDPAAGRKCFELALGYRELWAADEPKNVAARSYIMEAHMWLGIASSQLADNKAVTHHFDEALRMGSSLIANHPKDISFKGDLAEVHGARADALLRLGATADAARSSQAALENVQLVITSNPDDLSQLPLLALTHERLALGSLRLNQQPEADKHFQEALRLRTELLQIEPTSLSRQAAYRLALARCGKHIQAAQAAATARPKIARSTDLLLQQARCYARCAAQDTEKKLAYLQSALEALRAATGGEYRAATVLLTDPDLEPLRAEPAFKELVAQIQAR